MNEDTLRAADTWRTRGDAVALATIVRSRRSAPRPLGSKFAVSQRGEIAGSVSGGCVEGAVVEEARSVLDGGPPKLLYYGIADDEAWNVGLTCGGEIWIWVERYEGWEQPTERGARVTVIEGEGVGTVALVVGSAIVTGSAPAALHDAIVEAGEAAIASELHTASEHAGATLFAEALVPPPRVVIVGAVDTAEALCAMTRRLGWRTAVIDPRGSFATAERLPSADELVIEWPAEGYAAIELVPADHVVVLTHDPKLDDPAITAAVQCGASYIGALGSRRTQEKRRTRLLAAGLSEDQLEMVSGPVGLDIGAHTPEETAVAILGEIIAVRNGRDGRRLSETTGRIHVAAD